MNISSEITELRPPTHQTAGDIGLCEGKLKVPITSQHDDRFLSACERLRKDIPRLVQRPLRRSDVEDLIAAATSVAVRRLQQGKAIRKNPIGFLRQIFRRLRAKWFSKANRARELALDTCRECADVASEVEREEIERIDHYGSMVGSLVPEDDWQKVIRTAQSAREKRAELERMIFDCLVARLSPEDRKLIELWRTTGSRLELAIATNRSEKSINTQLFRAKKRLKKIAIDHGLTSEFL